MIHKAPNQGPTPVSVRMEFWKHEGSPSGAPLGGYGTPVKTSWRWSGVNCPVCRAKQRRRKR